MLLVIEVSDSTLRHDRDVKLGHYAAARIPEYWIVDLASNLLRVYRSPSERTYASAFELSPDRPASVETFPDRQFSVGELLRNRPTDQCSLPGDRTYAGLTARCRASERRWRPAR